MGRWPLDARADRCAPRRQHRPGADADDRPPRSRCARRRHRARGPTPDGCGLWPDVREASPTSDRPGAGGAGAHASCRSRASSPRGAPPRRPPRRAARRRTPGPCSGPRRRPTGRSGGRGAPRAGRRPRSGTCGSKVTTCVGASPCAASHSSFSSSVHIFSFVIGIHGWTVAMLRTSLPPAISVSSGEALRERPSFVGLRGSGPELAQTRIRRVGGPGCRKNVATAVQEWWAAPLGRVHHRRGPHP